MKGRRGRWWPITDVSLIVVYFVDKNGKGNGKALSECAKCTDAFILLQPHDSR